MNADCIYYSKTRGPINRAVLEMQNGMCLQAQIQRLRKLIAPMTELFLIKLQLVAV